jgi:putative salt-induced outer membrane protein YdiY
MCVIVASAATGPAGVFAQGADAEPGATMETMPQSTLEGDAIANPDDASQTPIEETAPEDIVESSVPEAIDPWEAFFPPPDSRFDWLKLTSGEWLKGEIKGLYGYKLDFESDELDTLTFDWEDVSILRSAGPQEVRYTDLENGRIPLTAYGQLTLVGNTATIGTSPTATTVKRDQIVTIAQGAQSEWDHWSGDLTIGANIRSGNSDVTDASVYFVTERRKAQSRFHADYRGTFSRTEGIETQNNHRVNGYFDSFVTSRLYWRAVFAEYFRDRFQNIQNQLTVGTGGGYDIIRTSKTEWDISAGVGALYKEAVSVEAGKDNGNTSPALLFGTLFDTELTKWLDYLFQYRLQVVDEENGSLLQNMVTSLSSDLIGELDLDLTLTWDRVEKPQPAEDGSVPEKDDFRFTVGISYEF